ncbi:MAG: 6-carboxyhexanoate--CoA ligase [Thermosediminibacterales bacterium]|nr:6-carboxyhexanoate--CoA ligase [Thermosediminibacterales bacterium]MDK2835755.1 6-carboxyhexanoate--CoA ligase [Thermosediminibacterales bacterium]
MKGRLYNVRMRAARGGRHEAGGEHVSGAERIVSGEALKKTVDSLLERALKHSKGKADFISITLEEIKEEEIVYIPPLPITTVEVENYIEGRKGVIRCLEAIGLTSWQAKSILSMLENTSSIRGAILVDINSLERLEPDLSRGVRATGMDWSQDILPRLNLVLDEEGINNSHVREAVALASKVVRAPGMVAEVCWSDDPDYTAGYVASKKFGYVRFTHLKPAGDARGGRIFCFDTEQASLEECMSWLEKQITVINQVPSINGKFSIKELLRRIGYETNN